MNRCAVLLIAGVAAMMSACHRSPAGPSDLTVDQTFVSFVSPPGGLFPSTTKRFTPGNARFAIALSADNHEVAVHIREIDGNETAWDLKLAAPPGQALAPGTYEGANGYTYPLDRAAMMLSGNGRGCGDSFGRFVVTRASFGNEGTIHEFRATFEYRCAQIAQALTGEVLIAAFDLQHPGGSRPSAVAGNWTGRIEEPFGVMPVSMPLAQSGSAVDGSWNAPTRDWSGTISGAVILGGFSGRVTFDGTYGPTGSRCSATSPVAGFLYEWSDSLVLDASDFVGSCPVKPYLHWVLQKR